MLGEGPLFIFSHYVMVKAFLFRERKILRLPQDALQASPFSLDCGAGFCGAGGRGPTDFSVGTFVAWSKLSIHLSFLHSYKPYISIAATFSLSIVFQLCLLFLNFLTLTRLPPVPGFFTCPALGTSTDTSHLTSKSSQRSRKHRRPSTDHTNEVQHYR